MRRQFLAAVLAGAAASAAGGAAKPKPFVPPNYPLNIAPVDWPNNPGTRYEMPELVKRYPKGRIVLKVAVDGWTEQLHGRDDMGSYRVGDRVGFRVVIGDRDSRYFGSVKDGRDGGDFRCVLYWMDGSGGKLLREDKTAVRPAHATCGGFFGMYFDIPSFAKTGSHRLRISYAQKKLGLDLHKDLHFRVVNDGSWDDTSVLDAALKKHPAVVVLQPGRACKALGVEAYAGLSDTYLHATHNVPDRNTDFANYGRQAVLRVGHYGQEQRALLRFDLSGVPAKAEVAEAWLQLYLSDWSGGERGRRSARSQFVAHEVLKDWQAGRGSGNYFWHNKKDPPIVAGEASWQHHAYPGKWTAPGCGKGGEDRSAEPVGKSDVVRGHKKWVTIPLEAKTVGPWVKDPAANRGLLLLGTGGGAVFHSGEFEDAAMRPRLIVAFSAGVDAAGAACAGGAACTGVACPLP